MNVLRNEVSVTIAGEVVASARQYAALDACRYCRTQWSLRLASCASYGCTSTGSRIDADLDKRLWQERYERDMMDVLLRNSEVAQAIVVKIALRLPAAPHARNTPDFLFYQKTTRPNPNHCPPSNAVFRF